MARLTLKTDEANIEPSHLRRGDRKNLVCVIDPALALSRYGVTLIKQLGKAMELWIGRELWHILENSNLYIQQPELIAPRGFNTPRTHQQERKALEEVLWALQAWEQFRLNTDLAGLNLFWLGDNTKESFLPPDRRLEILNRWEAIASVLDAQLKQPDVKDYILPLAFRDAIALATSLENTFILTYQPTTNGDKNSPPEICGVFEAWGIPYQHLTCQDPMVAIERDDFHQVLIHTNTAKVVWSGVHLAILHLLVPASFNLSKALQPTQPKSPLQLQESVDTPQGLMTEARGFWYLI
jgi:hypothetical protein